MFIVSAQSRNEEEQESTESIEITPAILPNMITWRMFRVLYKLGLIDLMPIGITNYTKRYYGQTTRHV